MTKTLELGKIKDIINLENGKVFLKDALGLTGCEISINVVPKGFKVPFNHKHKQKICSKFARIRFFSFLALSHSF